MKTPGKRSFAAERRTWRILGAEDPLWAICSQKGKEGGRWDLNEFLRTGEEVVSRYHELLIHHTEAEENLGAMLDFGCGVGRLTLAWSSRCTTVTGVDVSDSMIERAHELISQVDNVVVMVNESEDLRQFRDESFDCVTSHICLQHIPVSHALRYIREFGRICRKGGRVAFQLPASRRSGIPWGEIKCRLIESLPFGLTEIYRRWRSGSTARFKMFHVPSPLVERSAAMSGLRLVHREPDFSAGDDIESYIYVLLKN